MCLLDSKIGETVRTTQEQAVVPFLKCRFLGFLKGTSELVQYHHLNNQFGDYLSKLVSVGCLANWNQREKKEYPQETHGLLHTLEMLALE